jgi:hypothetical protein
MLSGKINLLIDAGLQKEHLSEPKRNYLGGSRIGVECERALQYEFFNAPKDEGKDFDGQTLRIFERGHWVEDAMIWWMRRAGVEMKTEDEGSAERKIQFGFSEHDGLFAGHCDGIITGGPEAFGPLPRLWENKGLGEKGWNSLSKHGTKKDKPVYYAQCQIYMEKFGLTKNPALFSAVNMNTMEIYWEAIPFDPTECAKLNAKAERILMACQAGELLPRISQDPTFFKCKWCDYNRRCFV